MCVIFWSVEHPLYDLVIASNRDEFLSRPTLPASWHDFNSHPAESSSTNAKQSNVLSARDSTAGGTWLGITKNGAFATLTNFTEMSAPLPQQMSAFESRGQLVRDWIMSQSHRHHGRKRTGEQVRQDMQSYLEGVEAKLDRFPGFNLLIGAVSAQGTVVGYITNRTCEGKLAKHSKAHMFLPNSFPRAATSNPCLSPTSKQAPPSGMSNSVLTQPWTKVKSGSLTFHSVLDQAASLLPDKAAAEQTLVEELYDLLWTSSNPKPVQRSELRNSVLIPPLELPAAGADGHDWYATRTSTVILVRKDGTAKLVERDTFKVVDGSPVWVNGPRHSGAIKGRHGEQRVFEWQIE